MLTADRLREVLDYSPDSGLFVWRVNMGKNMRAGQIAGGRVLDYVGIRIDKRKYMAHRLAWLWMTGEWPRAQIDHKNCVKDDNRWDNLREATPSQNGANRGAQANNKSGLKGVSWSKTSRRWRACGGRTHLGWYATKEEASAAYQAWAESAYGEYRR